MYAIAIKEDVAKICRYDAKLIKIPKNTYIIFIYLWNGLIWSFYKNRRESNDYGLLIV